MAVYPKLNRCLLKYLPEKGLILDAGCGNFQYANLLNRNDRTICLDLFLFASDEGKKNNFLFATVENLPFKDGSFDFVYCLSVIQLTNDKTRVIDEFHRVLKPGGRLFLAVPTRMSMFRLLRDLEIRCGVYASPQFHVQQFRYYSRGDMKRLTVGKFKAIDVSGYEYNFLPRLFNFLLAVTGLKSNQALRSTWKNIRREQLASPGNVNEESNIKSPNFDSPSNYSPSKFQIVSDFAYHYIFVLDRI